MLILLLSLCFMCDYVVGQYPLTSNVLETVTKICANDETDWWYLDLAGTTIKGWWDCDNFVTSRAYYQGALRVCQNSNMTYVQPSLSSTTSWKYRFQLKENGAVMPGLDPSKYIRIICTRDSRTDYKLLYKPPAKSPDKKGFWYIEGKWDATDDSWIVDRNAYNAALAACIIQNGTTGTPYKYIQPETKSGWYRFSIKGTGAMMPAYPYRKKKT